MKELKSYINTFQKENKKLKRISQQASERNDVEPNIGVDVAQLMGLLLRLTDAKYVLELGTCLGYSTVAFGQILQETGGKLISVEYNKDLYQQTKENVSKAGLDNTVDVILGDASKVINQLEGPFDIVFQDSDKTLYPEMLERTIEITRQNGLIIADDALFKAMGIIDRLSEPVHRYNEMVFSDDRLYSIILPIGDGLNISLKL